jgi:hypothetical protein
VYLYHRSISDVYAFFGIDEIFLPQFQYAYYYLREFLNERNPAASRWHTSNQASPILSGPCYHNHRAAMPKLRGSRLHSQMERGWSKGYWPHGCRCTEQGSPGIVCKKYRSTVCPQTSPTTSYFSAAQGCTLYSFKCTAFLAAFRCPKLALNRRQVWLRRFVKT